MDSLQSPGDQRILLHVIYEFKFQPSQSKPISNLQLYSVFILEQQHQKELANSEGKILYLRYNLSHNSLSILGGIRKFGGGGILPSNSSKTNTGCTERKVHSSIPLEVNASTDWQQQDLISEYGQGAQHTEHINTTLHTLQLATIFKV